MLAVWSRGHAPYPSSLDDLPDPPAELYALGDPTVIDAPTITLVGTRRATPYGVRIARAFGAAFARAGACVISGLALGIDAESHRAALAATGRACAVLGTGTDVEYPRENRATQRAIATHGLILSEYPPGTSPRRWHFPQRNRLMAALARATIVIEAGPTSGALYTAAIALDLGRTVGVVPGPIDSPASTGTNALLQHPDVVAITDTAAALALLTLPPPTASAPTLIGDERLVWDALASPAPTADTVVARTRLPTARCLAALAALELSGAIHVAHDGSLRRA